MSQPPPNQPPPEWRRPQGVAAGTWKYVNQWSIADRYDDFVADTPLCRLDDQIVRQALPGFPRDGRISSSSDIESDNKNLPPDNSQTVMDLGCGTGRTAIPLAERGYNVIGVDLSRRMLQVMASKSQPASDCGSVDEALAQSVHGVQANLVSLNCFADDCVDHAVCMFSTLGMIAGRENRLNTLRHASRMVRKGGVLVLHVHNRWAALREQGGFKRLALSWWNSARNANSDFGDATYAYRGLEKMFMHRYSRRELKQDLEDGGWDIKEIYLISLDGSSLVDSMHKAGGFIVIAQSD